MCLHDVRDVCDIHDVCDEQDVYCVYNMRDITSFQPLHPSDMSLSSILHMIELNSTLQLLIIFFIP
jgi:hypothetical protein